MERREPLARGGKPLQRRTPLRPAGPAAARDTRPLRVPRPRTTPASTGPTQTQRSDLHRKHKGRCVICAAVLEPGAYSDHHRAGRGMGGRKGAARADSNLPGRRLPLCGSGTTGCHGWVTDPPAGVTREHLEACGWVVRRSHPDPQSVLVWSWRGWLSCLDDGTVEVVPEVSAPPPPPQPWRPA